MVLVPISMAARRGCAGGTWLVISWQPVDSTQNPLRASLFRPDSVTVSRPSGLYRLAPFCLYRLRHPPPFIYPPMLHILTALWLTTPLVQDTAHVVLVATTDVHGHATDWDYTRRQPFAGGLARVATVVDSLKALYPGAVVVMDAGDVLQGDAFASYFGRVKPHDPHPLIEAMNLTGYDVATPGNHDFDWGLNPMRGAISGAAFPYVSGNIYALPINRLLYQPYVVLQRQGVRIGVTGLTTPGAMVWDG